MAKRKPRGYNCFASCSKVGQHDQSRSKSSCLMERQHHQSRNESSCLKVGQHDQFRSKSSCLKVGSTISLEVSLKVVQTKRET